MGKDLFNISLSRDHSSLTITEKGEQITFVESSCFDYNTGEWDTFVAAIPKSDFIEGVKEFLKKGACKANKLKMDTKMGTIYICVGERPEIFCSQHGKVSWIIVNKFDIEQFLKILKEMTKQ